jgi:SAM-dependent methyltransferase
MNMINEMIRKDLNCRICNSSKIINVFELKSTPSGDRFVSKSQLNQTSEIFPLILAICNKCGYLHLPYILNPKLSYTDYVYETKVTVGLDNHYVDYVQEIIAYSGIKPYSFVIDLGSNDGTVLKAFKESGMKVLGVEPNEHIAEIANQNQLDTINDYFSRNVTNRIIREYGSASIITANYMYANIDNIIEFTKNVSRLLDAEGLFVIQTGYHPEQMKINMFDYIYHEHFSYFSVKVLKQLLKQCGMELIHVSLHPAKGGSIRAIAQHRDGKRVLDESVELFVKEEENAGMHDPKTYIRFAEEIDKRKKKVVELIRKIKSAGHIVVGYGASVSTTTLLHHFEIGNYLDYIVDDNPIKHGLYSPGYHLPVYPSAKLYEENPDYVLVLGWQHQDSIINRNKKFLEDGGKFIVPLPTLKNIYG